jgi:2-amino-4-hydroxy-6-hydroxymethyldihydropteridine diphosphokinase
VNGRPVRRVFVSLGSNVGDRAAHLGAARFGLADLPATRVVGVSRMYETAPQDVQDQPVFLNQVVCLDTGLEPVELLAGCQSIEHAAGRTRTRRFGPRTLDVDILLVEGVESDDPQLTLPHPRLWRRAFVLMPLGELWSLARGMPAVDVAALATQLALEQPVSVFGQQV